MEARSVAVLEDVARSVAVLFLSTPEDVARSVAALFLSMPDALVRFLSTPDALSNAFTADMKDEGGLSICRTQLVRSARFSSRYMKETHELNW